MSGKEEDYFFWIGFCLYTVQYVEQTLAEVLTVALPERGIITVQGLEADSEENRRKTLGQLMKKINERARIDPGIEKEIDSFLSRRNLFVHRFQEEYLFGSSKGRQAAIAFCQELATDAYRLSLILSGILYATFEKLEAITKGAVHVDWDFLPTELGKSLREIAPSYPAIIRYIKSKEG